MTIDPAYVLDPSRPVWHGGDGLSSFGGMARYGLDQRSSLSDWRLEREAEIDPPAETPVERVYGPAKPKPHLTWRVPTLCRCGCGTWFLPRRRDQVYAVKDHAVRVCYRRRMERQRAAAQDQRAA